MVLIKTFEWSSKGLLSWNITTTVLASLDTGTDRLTVAGDGPNVPQSYHTLQLGIEKVSLVFFRVGVSQSALQPTSPFPSLSSSSEVCSNDLHLL